LQKTPWTCVNCCPRSLVAIWNRGAHGSSISGDDAHRRRGERGGKRRGGRREPVEGLGSRGGARRRPVRGGRHPAAVCVGGGGAPAADSGRARAWEHHRRVGEPVGGSAWSGRGRRVELHGEQGAVALMAHGGASGARAGAQPSSGRSGEGKRKGEQAPRLEGRACG